MPTVTHLHVHSYYTLLGATPSPKELAQRAAAEGLSHLGLTDTNALYGAVAFARACAAVGVQPITGMTVTVAWPTDLPRPNAGAPGHLVLLAQNPTGYRSLCQLSALLQGTPDAPPALTLADLRAHHAGLLCLTGGRRGWAAHALRQADRYAAHRFISKVAGLYGPQNTYLSLELQTPEEQPVAEALSALGSRMGLATVAVQPIYTLTPDDQARLRLLAAIDRTCHLHEVPNAALPDGGAEHVALHWLSPPELAARFAEYPKALARTQEIAARCAPALPTGTLRWPRLELPEDETPETTLQAQTEAGLRQRYPTPLSKTVQQRLARELALITAQGYAPLFLVVADIVRFAHAADIPVSTRGSVANSLVAYGLGITTVDPLAHDLLFERFLNPGRADPPDIDLDFCSRRRDAVLAYVRRTYGENHVALVGAMNTLRLRSAARETAKAYALTEPQQERLLTALPRRAYHPRTQTQRSQADVVAALDDPLLCAVATAAYEIVGFPHHLSLHAGGLVITPGPLTDLLPVQWTPKGYLCTQYDHADVAAVGLPKLDLLGIRALTVLADAAAAVQQHHTPDFRLAAIPPDDPETGALLARGDTVGVFQCDSQGARRTLRQLQARTVADLAVANAFFKPGPATGGQAAVFVKRYRGAAPARYLHPALEPILARTQGVLIFQEQVLRVATEIAGLSWAQADHLRRGMSKMQPAEMTQLQAQFLAGCQRPTPDGPGFTAEQAAQLWEQVAAFSGYGFNQGHATAYAAVSYRSAYLKAHYPAAFCWARLRNRGGYHHPAVYLAEALRLGLTVHPPHVNHSLRRVRLAGDAAQAGLWLGLELVRDLRRRAVAMLVEARQQAGPFQSLRDLLLRVPLQDKEIRHLIQCGALDGLGASRLALLTEAETIRRAGSAHQLALDLQSAATASPPAPVTQRWAWERHLLGYPLAALRAWLPALAARCAECVPLAAVPAQRGRVKVLGVRLPGWHRGGFAFWDGDRQWVWAEPVGEQPRLAPWLPVVVTGQWQRRGAAVGHLAILAWREVAEIESTHDR